MHIGSDHIDSQIEQMAEQEDGNEREDGTGQRTQDVDYAGNDCGGQHQRHQTGIGENISQPGCDIVQRGNTAKEFAKEALFMTALGGNQKDYTHNQQYRGAV